MALRFSNTQDFEVWLRMQADTKNAEQGLRGVGKATQEMTVEEFKAYMASQQMGNGLDQLSKKSRELQTNWWRTQRILRASTFVFQQVGIAGAALLAPFVLGIKKYVKEIEDMEGVVDPVVQKWTAATDSLEKSQMRLGRVAIQELLPYVEKFAGYIAQIATYAEQHPESVANALKIGAALVAISAIGIAVTTGIKLVVDVKFVAASAVNYRAAMLMEKASAQNMLAAGLQQKAGVAGGGIIGALKKLFEQSPYTRNSAGRWIDRATGRYVSNEAVSAARGTPLQVAGKTIASALVLAIAAYVGAEGGKIVGNALAKAIYGETYKNQDLKDAALTLVRIFQLPVVAYGKLLESLGGKFAETGHFILAAVQKSDDFNKKLFGISSSGEKAAESTQNVGSALDYLSQSASNAETELKGMQIVNDLQRDLYKMSQDYEVSRAKVIRDASIASGEATSKFNRDQQQREEDHLLKLKKMADDYRRDAAERAKDHWEKRAEIVKDSRENIKEIEQDHRREEENRLEELNARMLELAANRDALGLAKEQEKFDRESQKSDEETNIRIQRIKKDTAMRLREEDKRYAEEAAKRRDDYKRKVAEEIQQYELDTKRREQEFSTEQAQRNAATARKLADMAADYARERQQRIVEAYNKIRELQTAYQAERIMRQNYYQLILADARGFMESYRRELGQTSTSAVSGTTGRTPAGVVTRQLGGYVGAGLYLLHANEFVMSAGAARAAEKALGGALNQRNIVEGLQGKKITYTDNRRIDSKLSASDRRAIMNDTLAVLLGEA